MRGITVIALIFILNGSAFAQDYSTVAYGTEEYLSCDGYKYDGMRDLLQNKYWQMSTFYVDSIPLNDSIPKSFQFVFARDPSKMADSLVLYLIRKIGSYTTALEFRYTIDATNNLLKIYSYTDDGTALRNPNTPDKIFKVACLNPDHLALQYTEPDKANPAKTAYVEYRFMADY